VTGVSVIVIGLLLVLAALAAARIPGGATLRPGITRFALAPIDPATWYANGALFLGLFTGIAAGGFVLALISTGFTTLIGGIGLLFLALSIEGARLVARVERWRAFLGRPERPLPHLYKPLRGGPIDLLRAEFVDESRWRDVLYVSINVLLATLEFGVVFAAWVLALALLTAPGWYGAVAGITLPRTPVTMPQLGEPMLVLLSVAGLVLLAAAASLSQLVMTLHRAVVTGLLCTSESRELRRQVETLRESRSAVLDVEASELQRIERDLHDGAQQRLVMLSIDLGLAGERIDTDPAAARALIAEGQEQARQALADIRQLVRGIAPSILLDRGLPAALESISGLGPVPAVVRFELAPGERLSPAAERTAYFVATEALANVAKHSGATRAEVRLRREDGAGAVGAAAGGAGHAEAAEGAAGARSRLIVEVWDDGSGGASLTPGGGLEGLARRVAGVDGTFSVSSPPGGPTVVRAEIPVEPGPG
jgi:signal transduction histidine kinase